MSNSLKWVSMVLRLCCNNSFNMFILKRLLMIMGLFVELNLLKVCKGFMILDIVDDRLNDAIIVSHSFVNYGSGDIERALIRVRIRVVKCFEYGVIFEVNWLYIMLIVILMLKLRMSNFRSIDDFWFMVYLFMHSM